MPYDFNPFPPPPRFKRILLNLFVFSAVFIGIALLFASTWLKKTFEIEHFSQIVFHLKFPVANAGGSGLVHDFFLKSILPATFIALLITFSRQTWAVLVFLFRPMLCFFQKHASGTRLVLAVVMLGLSVNIVVNKWEIKDYFKEQKNISTFYETHYKPFDFAALEGFKPFQNLIVIFVEGLPSALSHHDPYAPLGDVAPKIGELATRHINFSTNSKMGGLQQMLGTGWTVAGIAAYLCGVPLNVPPNDAFKPEYFLNGATCVPDVLHKLGYTQAYLSGTPQKLGAAELFQAHNVKLLDLQYLQEQKIVPNPLPKAMTSVTSWSLSDRETFKLAKKKIQGFEKAGKPFALYISTIDTHGENLAVGTHSCPEMPRSLLDFYKCEDLLIADFVDFVEKSELGKNTSIVILGDHLPHGGLFQKRVVEYGIFNAFINTPFEKNVDKEKSKYRFVTHFDMAPVLLESVGIKSETFGLGRNPFYHQSLLESPFDKNTLNNEIRRGNKMYDSFWQVE